MQQILEYIRAYLHAHQVAIIKDIVIPTLGIDKILGFIALIYAIRSFNSSYKVGKVNFLLQLTTAHRDIWTRIHQSNLTRIRDPNADPKSITEEESRHVIFIIMNMQTLFEAHINDVYKFNKASQFDTGKFFNLPIPNQVWQNSKIFYDISFVKFMDKIKVDAYNKINGIKPKIYIFLLFIKFKNRLYIYSIYAINNIEKMITQYKLHRQEKKEKEALEFDTDHTSNEK